MHCSIRNYLKHNYTPLRYLNVVENSEILIPFTKPKQNENELINKLAKCKIVAQKEFIICHNEIVDIFNNIIKIEKNINQDIDKIKTKFSTHNDIGEKIFDEFNFRLSEIFNFAGDKLIGSFQDKVKRIDNFTICLFGRTKVGKSTTMEALTKGKGYHLLTTGYLFIALCPFFTKKSFILFQLST